MAANDYEPSENSSLLRLLPDQAYGSQNVDRPTNVNMSTDPITVTSHAKKWPQYVAALSAAGGALAAGTLLGWSSPAGPLLTKEEQFGFPINDDEFSWIGAAVNLGAACVCIPIGILINIIGRKWSMLSLVIPFTIGWILLILATNLGMMIAGRFILGIAGGAFCVAAPLYTGEIAQKEIRGTVGTFFQLMITVGILFVYAIGSELSVVNFSIVCAVIPLIFGVIFFFMPESPLYLVAKNRNDDAKMSLQFLRGKDYPVENELLELQEENEKAQEKPVSVLQALKRRSSIRALVIGIGLMFFQQMSGINAVIFYTTDIFKAANISLDSEVATIIVGVVQVIATFVSTMVVDRLGRRILLLASSSVMAICTILLGVYFYLKDLNDGSADDLGWLTILSLCVFIIMFSIGFGPIPWMMMGELFATDIKGLCGSLAGTFNWLLAFIVTKTFVNLKGSLGNGETFWLFSALSIVGTVFVFFVVPETKGKSLLEIQQMLEE